MNKLENLKMVLFDFDDTLAVHSQGHRISDHLMKYMINVHSGSKELWNTSKPNLQLKKFMDYLACKNISMGLISGVHDCKAAERKIEWVKENYGYSLENYCVSSQEQKMIELSTIAELMDFIKTRLLLLMTTMKISEMLKKWDLQHFLLWKLLIWLIAFKIQIWEKC